MNTEKKLYQWDTGQKLTGCTGLYVDFPIGNEVYRVETTDGMCIIPDELLQTSGGHKVYECMTNNTIRSFAFSVTPRPKPPDYVFTPTERLTFEGLVQKVDDAVADMIRRAESGEFDGHTPVKGTDYFTTAEIQQIQNEVSSGAIGEFKTVVDTETETFNNNAETKLNAYNQNDSQKTNAYNTNATKKLNAYNSNANNRVAEFDSHTEQIQTDISELKSDLDNIVDKKNLFFTKVDGYYVNQENGKFDAHEQYYRSDFIRVSGGETYTFSNGVNIYSGFRLFCYDSSKNPITGSGHYQEQTITTPSNASYIVFSDYIAYFSNVQFEKGSTPTEYSEGGKIKYSSIPIIEPDKCSFFEKENNEYKIPQKYIKQDIKSFDVNLPSKLYALVGEELNVYFDNIVDGYDSEYEFDVECDVGQNLGDCYRIEPTSEGTVSLKITVSKDGYSVEKNCTIYVASRNARSGVNKKILVMGDSTTAHGNVIVHLNGNMSNDVMNITTVGTQGESPNNHEGRSGWKYDTYFKEKDGSVVNPFYNPSTGTFDAQYYFTNNPSVPIPDYWFIHLGINDMFEMTGTLIPWKINKVIGQMNTVISSIKSVNTNIKVCICLTIPPSYTQDAFGRAYKCSPTRNEQKHSVFEYVKRLIAEFENRETDGIFIVPYHVNLDTRHNMVSLETKYNKRNDRKEVMTTGGGAVHPADSGYWQMADTLWFFLKNDN